MCKFSVFCHTQLCLHVYCFFFFFNSITLVDVPFRCIDVWLKVIFSHSSLHVIEFELKGILLGSTFLLHSIDCTTFFFIFYSKVYELFVFDVLCILKSKHSTVKFGLLLLTPQEHVYRG